MRKLALISILCFVAFAGGLLPVRAQASDDTFIPGSAWLVGSASLIPASGGDTTGLPCIMMNQYNNGFIVRVSGGGGQIMAMAVDFRQDVFKTNKDYNINIRIPETSFDANIPARAYNRQSLLFGTQETIGLYDALKKARTLEITVGKKTLEFAMIGARDGIERMEACYSGTNAYKKERKTEHSKASPGGFGRNDQGTAKSIARMGYTPPTASRASEVTAPDVREKIEDEDVVLTPLPMEGDETGAPVFLDIDGTLKQASDNLHAMEPAAGVPRSPAAEPAPQGQMMAKSWQSPLAPEQKQSYLSGQREIMVPPADGRQSYQVATADDKVADPSDPLIRRWRAIRGSNLREVLDNWSNGANVRLLWLSDRDFPVKESMILQGSFEEAVLTLLEQYQGRNVPVGRMYNDPAAGRRVLLIERH